jgi:hypothetical protein
MSEFVVDAITQFKSKNYYIIDEPELLERSSSRTDARRWTRSKKRNRASNIRQI